ncbi:MAG: NUDIX hydrolase [FCB group bacterium]|jgi:8-oxo-dGTP pyrophosphatase MutT (NUDIX family)
MVAKWETVSRDEANDLKIFKASWFHRRHPEWGREGNFVVLDSPTWVNIIPITVDNNVLLIEQYRHGIDDLTLEVPGGLVESGEKPRIAAERECLEETGFKGSGEAILIGENYPNPAFLNNICYSFLWTGCTKIKEQSLDRHEDIRVIEVPVNEIKQMILDKKIRHSLVLTAFFFYNINYGL